MTALMIEPDEAAQRQILALLSARGYRVVPVANADTGLELAQRMRFDAAFCSVHAPGLNWVELSSGCFRAWAGSCCSPTDTMPNWRPISRRRAVRAVQAVDGSGTGPGTAHHRPRLTAKVIPIKNGVA